MQEDAFQEAQKLKQEQLAQTAKRPPRNYAKLKLPIKKEEAKEPVLPEPTPAPTPAPPQPKQRGRKSKKSTVVSCCIPIQPEVTDADKEMAMMKKISDILVRHKFHDSKTPEEISDLVSRVRDIVTSGQIDQLDTTDEFTMSLANVFLQKEEAPMPALTDIDYQPVAGSSTVKEDVKASKSKGRKKGSGRKLFVYEDVPSTSAEHPKAPPDAEGCRTRRRAAIAAERNFDTIDDCIVDMGDDDWQNYDSDSVPVSQIKQKKDNEEKPVENPPQFKSLRAKKNIMTKVQNDVIPEETTEIQKDVVVQDESIPLSESILLSDDDEPPSPPRRKPGPARKTRNRRTKDIYDSKEKSNQEQPQATCDIPLHPTLLSNKNFIKIVAHTYLSGNPMLDEDAATLAAQYSTFKALKEYESTGKSIVTGPIYDIAVKVSPNIFSLVYILPNVSNIR